MPLTEETEIVFKLHKQNVSIFAYYGPMSPPKHPKHHEPLVKCPRWEMRFGAIFVQPSKLTCAWRCCTHLAGPLELKRLRVLFVGTSGYRSYSHHSHNYHHSCNHSPANYFQLSSAKCQGYSVEFQVSSDKFQALTVNCHERMVK